MPEANDLCREGDGGNADQRSEVPWELARGRDQQEQRESERRRRDTEDGVCLAAAPEEKREDCEQGQGDEGAPERCSEGEHLQRRVALNLTSPAGAGDRREGLRVCAALLEVGVDENEKREQRERRGGDRRGLCDVRATPINQAWTGDEQWREGDHRRVMAGQGER